MPHNMLSASLVAAWLRRKLAGSFESVTSMLNGTSSAVASARKTSRGGVSWTSNETIGGSATRLSLAIGDTFSTLFNSHTQEAFSHTAVRAVPSFTLVKVIVTGRN